MYIFMYKNDHTIWQNKRILKNIGYFKQRNIYLNKDKKYKQIKKRKAMGKRKNKQTAKNKKINIKNEQQIIINFIN